MEIYVTENYVSLTQNQTYQKKKKKPRNSPKYRAPCRLIDRASLNLSCLQVKLLTFVGFCIRRHKYNAVFVQVTEIGELKGEVVVIEKS